MQTIFTKRLLTIIALCLAIVMSFSACNGDKKGDTTSKADDTVNTDTEQKEDNGENTADADQNTEGTDSKQESTGSKTQSGSKNPTSTNGKYTWGSSDPDEILKTIPDSVKQKELHILMWRSYTDSEQKQIDDFQAKTGMKIRTTYTTEYEMSTKLIALISDKDSPDVVHTTSMEYPSRATKAMQLLDPKIFRLDDECWSRSDMEPFRVKSKYYTVAMTGTWNVDDCNYVTIYNKSILKEAGVTTLPYELYKAGNWNWAEQQKMMEKVKASGKTGMTIQCADLNMLSAGVDFAKYDADKAQFVSLLDDPKVRPQIENAWKALQEATNKELITTFFDIYGFRMGKYGFMDIITFTLYNQGGHHDGIEGGIDNIEAVPLAGPTQSTAYVPLRAKAWGVAKGAKNVEGAAYFIRYYLDPKTFDMSSTFHHKQFEEVFNIVTKSDKKITLVGLGVTDYSNGTGTYNKICNELASATVGQAPTIINKNKGKIENSLKRANSAVERIASKIK